MRAMNYEYWLRKFVPTGTPVEGKSDNWEGKMFETFGSDLKTVLAKAQASPEHVWTMVEGERNRWYIAPGYHLVNRIGYFITEKPALDFSRDVLAF